MLVYSRGGLISWGGDILTTWSMWVQVTCCFLVSWMSVSTSVDFLYYLEKNGGEMAKMWILFRSIDSWACSLGGPWTGWIGSAPVQMSGCSLGAALSWSTGALLHRCFPFNLSTTTQGAIVKLRGASLELCTLLTGSVWNSKITLARGPRTVLGYVGQRWWGVEVYWCLRKWV